MNSTLFSCFLYSWRQGIALGSIRQSDLFDDIDQDTGGNEKTERAHRKESRQR